MKRNWSPGRPLPLWDRFWSHVDPNGPIPAACPELGPCWLWTGRLNHIGYGRFFLTSDTPRLSAPPHRWLYEQLTDEPFPEGQEPDHLCFNRGCVNPAHLEPVTHRENVLRGTSFMATKAAQTECVNGHPFTEENIYRRPGQPGWRACRACLRDRARERYRAQRTRNGVSG